MSHKKGTAHHLKEEVAEFFHTMAHTDHSFRMIVVKKTTTPILHRLEQFLTEEELLSYASERYSVIATNDLKMSPEEIVYFYRQRGDTSEVSNIGALWGFSGGTNYIHHNPVKRGYVDEAKHWRYSSARDYEGIDGLIEVEKFW